MIAGTALVGGGICALAGALAGAPVLAVGGGLLGAALGAGIAWPLARALFPAPSTTTRRRKPSSLDLSTSQRRAWTDARDALGAAGHLDASQREELLAELFVAAERQELLRRQARALRSTRDRLDPTQRADSEAALARIEALGEAFVHSCDELVLAASSGAGADDELTEAARRLTDEARAAAELDGWTP